MDEIKQSMCPPFHLRQEHTPLHLGGDAVGVKLVDVIDVGKNVHHPMLLHLAEGVKVEVVVALMP
jgi:hypothetical protein